MLTSDHGYSIHISTAIDYRSNSWARRTLSRLKLVWRGYPTVKTAW